ncbi:hypothetical protein C8A05DRAFT_16500 [Staphylotrichum tortipilum]|uniref:Uncharacterized protein n=1 Tax=Staphylotrichum tortipilum TaxID=2831512 RepID=A0AAN6MI50_9PEZI|nr:hypothetical protein C8A05DRAFT_16500 [Staphylotrichum longicolle]
MPSLPKRDFHPLPIPGHPSSPPNLSLSNSSIWTYCGPLLPLTTPLPATYQTWQSRTLSAPLEPYLLPLLHVVHAFLAQHSKHHYWLTIRASRPTTEFDAPRWHTDDHFFDPARSADAVGLWKLCAALQGPGTMFAADGKGARAHVCSVVRCVACGATGEEVRAVVAKGLEGREVVHAGAHGEMVFFRGGGGGGGGHAEGRIGGDRVFVNVVPGTEEELRGLMARWGMEFPRSWSFGVPLMLDGDGEGEWDGRRGEETRVVEGVV